MFSSRGDLVEEDLPLLLADKDLLALPHKSYHILSVDEDLLLPEEDERSPVPRNRGYSSSITSRSSPSGRRISSIFFLPR